MATNTKAWEKALKKSLRAVYEANKYTACYLCVGMTGSRELAESVTAEALEAVWESVTPGTIPAEAALGKSFLKKVLELCTDVELAPQVPEEELPFWYGLEQGQKELFVLRYLIALSNKEIATTLNQPLRKITGAGTAQDPQLAQRIEARYGVDCGSGAAVMIHIRQQVMLEQNGQALPAGVDRAALAILNAQGGTESKGKRRLLPILVVAVLVLGVAAFAVVRGMGGGSTSTPSYYAEIAIEDYGTITVALDAEAAPETVANFVALAEEGFYDGLTFHRIIEGFMMQGGDPNGDGTGGSENTITGEFSDNGYENNLSHTRGAISMARSTAYDSASSQFFIVQEDATYLDGSYACFGYVIDGMDIVDQICADAEPTDDNGTIASDAQPVITGITIYTAAEYNG